MPATLRAPLTALLLIALVAGCVAPSSAPGAQSTPVLRKALRPDAQPVAFAPPTVLGSVPFASEVSLATAPDGSVYVTSPASQLRSAVIPPRPPLWRSDDGGATYQFLGTPGCALGLPACAPPLADDGRADLTGPGDAELAVTRDGVVHWAGLVGQGGAEPYQRSFDKGLTWSKPVNLDQDGDREWLAPRARDGALFASWRFGNDSMLTVRASYDSGGNWTPAVGAASDGVAGPVAVAQYGDVLLLPHFASDGVHVARSVDDGRKWTDQTVWRGVSHGHIFPIASIDSNGTAYIVWAADPAPAVPVSATSAQQGSETPVVFLAVSHDGGRAWSAPKQLNAAGTSAIFPWIVAGGPGRVAITWLENPLGTPLRIGGPWQIMAIVATDADAPNAVFTPRQVTVNPVRVGPVCTEGGGCTTDGGDRSLLDFFEVDLHRDGYPVVAWPQDSQERGVRVDIATSRMTSGPDLLAGIPLAPSAGARI